MGAWRDWYHVTGCTYGAWLPGDPRGFRTRHHRQHVEGDYNDPPPEGLYEALHDSAKRSMKKPTVRLTRRQRRIAVEIMVEALKQLSVEPIAASVDAVHLHVLGRFVGGVVRPLVGRAKGRASHALGRAGLQGTVWAKGCRPLPIRDRRHQVNVYHYIRKHMLKGACVWTFRDGIIEPEGMLNG